MKNYSPSYIYIHMNKIVNHITEEHIKEAERIELDPQKILALIDLIFMYEDESRKKPVS